MNTPALYSEPIISGSCTVRFYDLSSIYFGDYHHVRLEARCEFELQDPQVSVSDGAEIEGSFRGPAVYTRMLERMAVASAAVEDAKTALIEDFRKNTLPYLSDPDFPLKMLSKNAPGKKSVMRKYPAS